MKTYKILVSLDVDTNSSLEKVVSRIKKGIVIGLDLPPNGVASPNQVKINYCQER